MNRCLVLHARSLIFFNFYSSLPLSFSLFLPTTNPALISADINAQRLASGLQPRPLLMGFLDQQNSVLAVWRADHLASPPQIASAFFASTNRVAASTNAASLR